MSCLAKGQDAILRSQSELAENNSSRINAAQRMLARVLQSRKFAVLSSYCGHPARQEVFSTFHFHVRAPPPHPSALPMSVAISAPRVLARAVCAWSLASARGGHGFAAASVPVASKQCAANVGTARLAKSRRACSPRAATVTADGENDEHAGDTYEVHPVAGDGRCLFRSVAVAMALRGDGDRAAPAVETAEADRLRNAAVDDLHARRADVEWFIEGDFKEYCASMRTPHAWGGEPEILSLANVLKVPIEVFMASQVVGTKVKSIGVYGENGDDSKENPIAILFRGLGHYEALTKCVVN